MYIKEFQSFFDQSEDIIGLVSADLKYVAVNLALCRYWGVERERIIGTEVPSVVGQAAWEKAIKANMEACLAGEEIAYDCWIDFPGVGRRFTDVKYSPRRDADDNVNGIFIIAHDKTESKLLEEKVQTERDKYDSILSSVNVGLVLYNPDYSIAWTNNQTKLMYDCSDLQGNICYEVFMNNASHCEDCPTMKTFATGESHSLEVYLERYNVWHAVTTVPIFDDEGAVQQVLGHVLDITESKIAQEALLISEQRFREIFENVDMIAVQGYDKDRRVVYWNPASEKLYGYTRDEAMGNLLEELIIPEPAHEMVKAAHKAWVNGGPAIPAAEIELVHKDGHPVPVHSSHVMQKTASGEKFMYCVDVDLAEIKRIHNQLVRAKEEAEAANHAKSEFLANMSHEIRTPLNGIQGMFTLLEGTELDDTQRDYAQAGMESAVRLNRLLSDILDLSRVEAGKMAMEKEMFNLPNLVLRIEELFQLAFDDVNIALHRQVDDDVPLNLVGDSARLQQVLTNLVGNALKYTESGEVCLTVSRLSPIREGEQRILFSVSDTGIGISKAMLDALFEPFVQGSRGYARRYQGAGLGLSICKRLVDLMGGSMSVESLVGKGSTFHVALSFKEATHVDQQVTQIIDADKLAIKLNVLLAEDDRINSMVGRRLLEKAGCSVTVVTDGLKAVSAVREHKFDAVFMDVQMPQMDGVEATMAIRSGQAGPDNVDIPIIALTAYTMAGDKEKFMQSGMDNYIPKPVEMGDVLRTLRDAAQKRSE